MLQRKAEPMMKMIAPMQRSVSQYQHERKNFFSFFEV